MRNRWMDARQVWGCLLWISIGWAAAGADAVVHEPDRGRVVLRVADAVLEGAGLRRDTVGGAMAITGWDSPGDRVQWEYQPTRWGRYDVFAECAGPGNLPGRVEVVVAGRSLSATLERSTTGGGDAQVPLGRWYLAEAKPFSVTAHCEPAGLALRSVSLVPAPEGRPIAQAADGSVTLESSEATTHSVLMRYEPATNKNCLGYWANPSDWADWEFSLANPTVFDIEVWQGCGRDHGGSDVVIEVGGKTFPMRVEETGHFQNFVPRHVGRIALKPGDGQRLAIKPQRKQGGAVMDIRRIRLVPSTTAAEPAPGARDWVAARRVVVLGDSITYGGEWVELLATWMRLAYPDARTEFLNLGLPSETASGLSEPGHAGGAFPRPDVHERLARVLARTQPDLILACYGMNDGIYFPFREERFQKFREGITRLREAAAHEGVRVIHLTPPVFDPVPLAGRTLPDGLESYPQPFEGYNAVLDRYSEWLLSRRSAGWEVVDIHGPMNRFLAEQRARDPKFLLAGDGVHANAQGHWLIAREMLRQGGASEAVVTSDTSAGLLDSDSKARKILALEQQRHWALKDAWLTAVGHQRPGMPPGLSLEEAERVAAAAALPLDPGR